MLHSTERFVLQWKDNVKNLTDISYSLKSYLLFFWELNFHKMHHFTKFQKYLVWTLRLLFLQHHYKMNLTIIIISVSLLSCCCWFVSCNANLYGSFSITYISSTVHRHYCLVEDSTMILLLLFTC